MRSLENDHYDENLTIKDFCWITVVQQNRMGPKRPDGFHMDHMIS